MYTNISVKDAQLLLEYEYYDYKRGNYYTKPYPIYCLSDDEAMQIRDRLLSQYKDLGTAKNEVYRYIQSNDFYNYHIEELLNAFTDNIRYDNTESSIYVNEAQILLNISSNIVSYFTDLNINNRNNNLDAYVIDNVPPAMHIKAISHTNIIGCVEGEIEIVSNGKRIQVANGKYSVGILLYKALLFVKYDKYKPYFREIRERVEDNSSKIQIKPIYDFID